MLPCTKLTSNSIGVPARMLRPQVSGGGACCRQAGSLVASMSMMLLWVDVWDYPCGPSGVVFGALHQSDSRC